MKVLLKGLILLSALCLSNTGISQFLLFPSPSNDNFPSSAGNAGNFNVSVGYHSGANVTGNNNVFFGSAAGYNTTTGFNNFFAGYFSGHNNISGRDNVFLGYHSGYYTTASYNTFLGSEAGKDNVTGFGNVFVGFETGQKTTSSYNSFIGTQAGTRNTTGERNLFLGYRAGFNTTTGSGNVFLGYQAGFNNATASNLLYIDNSGTTSPLIRGDFASDILTVNGNLGVGTNTPTYQLHAIGNIYADGGWMRVSGDRGIYFQTHGGGFRMTDDTWIRTYGNKNFLHNTGIMRTQGEFQVGIDGDRFRVQTDGSVGIGTSSPERTLSVAGHVRSAYDDTEAEYVEIWHGGGNGFINTVGDGNLDFRHNSTTLMSLNEAGDIELTAAGGKVITPGGNSDDWNDALSWGNHNSAGYYKTGSAPDFGEGLNLRGLTPTIHLNDTDNGDEASLHLDGNWFYILSHENNSADSHSSGWDKNGSHWPVRINLTNDNLEFGGDTFIKEGDFFVENGNVGIGIATPVRPLSVAGYIRSSFDNTDTEYVEIGHGGSNGFINITGDGNLDFRHDHTTMMSLTETGDLELVGSTGKFITPGGNSDQWNDLVLWGDHNNAGYYKSGSDVTLGTISSGLITSSGYIKSTNTTDPTEYVEIGHGGSNGFIKTVGDGNLDFRHGTTTLMSLTEDGRLGIGTPTPDVPLSVVGSIQSNLTDGETDFIRMGVESVAGNQVGYFETSATKLDFRSTSNGKSFLKFNENGDYIIDSKIFYQPEVSDSLESHLYNPGTADLLFLSRTKNNHQVRFVEAEEITNPWLLRKIHEDGATCTDPSCPADHLAVASPDSVTIDGDRYLVNILDLYGNLALGPGAYIDDEDDGTTDFGEPGDDWINLNGYVGLSSSDPNHGIKVFPAASTYSESSFTNIGFKNGKTYLASAAGYDLFFLEANNRDVTFGGNITMPESSSASLSRISLIDHEHVSGSSGDLYFDANVWNDSGNGFSTHFTAGDGGAIAYKGEEGWGAVLATNNMEYITAKFDGLEVTKDVTFNGKIVTTLHGNSEDWHNTATTVTAKAQTWDDAVTDVTTLNNKAEGWDNTTTTVTNKSGDWDDAYSERGSQIAGSGLSWDGTTKDLSINIGSGLSFNASNQLEIDENDISIPATKVTGLPWDPSSGTLTYTGNAKVTGAFEAQNLKLTGLGVGDKSLDKVMVVSNDGTVKSVLSSEFDTGGTSPWQVGSGRLDYTGTVDVDGALEANSFSSVSGTFSSILTSSLQINGLISGATFTRVLMEDGSGNLGYKDLSSFNFSHWNKDASDNLIYESGIITSTKGIYSEVGASDLALVVKNGSTTNFKVDGAGNIRGRKLELDLQTSWPDFVFKEAYELRSLEEVETYVKTNHHLPDVPSEKEVRENGIDVAEMESVLLQKIEELTLYIIEQNKTIKGQQEELKQQKNDFAARLEALEQKIGQ